MHNVSFFLYFFPSKANVIVALRLGLFPPALAETESWGEGLLCAPNMAITFRPSTVVLWPSLLSAAGPLLAPGFLDPGFLGLSVVLAFPTGLLSLRLYLTASSSFSTFFSLAMLVCFPGRRPLYLIGRGLLPWGHIGILILCIILLLLPLLLQLFLLFFLLLPGQV